MPVKQWHEALGDATIADAILDRLIHKAYRIEFHGHESLPGSSMAGIAAPGRESAKLCGATCGWGRLKAR